MVVGTYGEDGAGCPLCVWVRVGCMYLPLVVVVVFRCVLSGGSWSLRWSLGPAAGWHVHIVRGLQWTLV